MTRKDELLAAYDDAMGHQWESLEYALQFLTEEESAYQDPIYSDIPQEEGHPSSGTILWHLVHLATCYRWYKLVIEERPRKPEETGPPEVNSLAEAIEHLYRDRAALRETIAAIPEDRLEENLFSGKTVANLARATVRHDAWHAAQIVVAKRLYRHRDRRAV